MMNGGLVPGGSCRASPVRMAVICAMAASTLTPGWKNDLDHRDAAQRLRLDVLDVVDRGGHRALEAASTIRAAISSADRPA